MKKLKYILLCVFILTATNVFAVNVTIPQATEYGVIPRGNANGTYTPVATSTLFGYTPLNQSLYYSTTTFTSLTTAPNLSITKSQVSDFGTPVTSISVASANGFAGSSSGGATPALTLSTSITGMLKGNGTAISSASNGTDYTLITAKTCNSGDFVSQVTASGVFTCTTPSGTTYTATYPIQLTANDFSLAFGTTTSNTWAGTQSFTNTANFNTLTNNGNATTTNLAITALTGILVGNGSTKPISTAVSGTDLKTINSTSIIGSGDIAVQPTLVSGTNIKTINGASVLGSGDLTVTGGSGLSSSTPWTTGGVTYVTGNSTLGSVATGTISAGTGISLDSSVRSVIGGNLQITNSAPDQTVVLNNGTGISVTGTYPNFTITNTGSTFAFPFTVNSGYNATSTVIGFNGLFSTASSTFGSALRLPSLSQGSLYVGSTGLVNTIATSAPTVTAPITYSGTLGSFVGGTGGAFDCTSANGSTKGCITSTDWTTFNNKQATISTTFPITLSGTTVGFGGLSTSSAPTIGQMPYWTGVNTFGSVATTTATCAGTVSCTSFTILGSTPITLTGSASGGTQSVSTSTNETNGQIAYWTTTSGTPAKLGSVATTSLTATAPITLSQPISVIGSSASAITCADANTSTKGCITSTDWNTFNNKLGTYDAWTHPATGYSATTSALTISSTATSTFAGRLSVGTTSATTLNSATFTVKGLMSAVMQIFTSAGTKIMDVTDTVVTLLGTWDFSGATVKQHTYATFAYSTSTAWTGTTTIALGVAFNAEAWNQVKCYTDTGTLNVSVYDGTNRMNMFNASTTIGTVTLSTNNTFTASEKRYIDIGTPASSPTKISCTTDVIVNN